MAQAFDKVWHPGLLYKLKNILLLLYYLFFKSYLVDCYFITKVGSEIFLLAPITAGDPRVVIASPVLFNLYSADQLTTPLTSVANFLDDEIIYSSYKDYITAVYNLQNHLDLTSS